MKNKNDLKPKSINFKKAAYRGILTEAAQKTGTSQENISILYKRGNPKVVKEVNKLIESRIHELERTYLLADRLQTLVGASA